MRVQALTEEERDILKALRTGEAVREIPMPMRGRLSLYNLVTETRQGWIITDEGREALMKAAKMRNRFADGSEGVSVRGLRRSRNMRKSPFDF